jgi:hypothetical protein
MTIETKQQLLNSKEKLRQLEEHYQRRKDEPTDNDYARQVSLRSLRRLMNQLKEEIIRFEAHHKVSS